MATDRATREPHPGPAHVIDDRSSRRGSLNSRTERWRALHTPMQLVAPPCTAVADMWRCRGDTTPVGRHALGTRVGRPVKSACLFAERYRPAGREGGRAAISAAVDGAPPLPAGRYRATIDPARRTIGRLSTAPRRPHPTIGLEPTTRPDHSALTRLAAPCTCSPGHTTVTRHLDSHSSRQHCRPQCSPAYVCTLYIHRRQSASSDGASDINTHSRPGGCFEQATPPQPVTQSGLVLPPPHTPRVPCPLRPQLPRLRSVGHHSSLGPPAVGWHSPVAHPIKSAPLFAGLALTDCSTLRKSVPNLTALE